MSRWANIAFQKDWAPIKQSSCKTQVYNNVKIFKLHKKIILYNITGNKKMGKDMTQQLCAV
jgi:hypothetical protein